jgi:hypothetical protein
MTRDPRYPHLPPREAFIGTQTSTPAESYFGSPMPPRPTQAARL